MSSPPDKKRSLDTRSSHARHPLCGTCGKPLARCGLKTGRVIIQFAAPGRPRLGFHFRCTDLDLVARRLVGFKLTSDEIWQAVDDVAARGPERVIASAPYWRSRPPRQPEAPQQRLPCEFADPAVG